VRNPALTLGVATLATLVVVAVLFLVLLFQLRQDVQGVSAAIADEPAAASVVDELRDLQTTVDRLSARVDDMAARFDRLDASIAQIPTEQQNDTRIGTILSEIQELQGLLGGLSFDLGIVCDVLGC
jgi:uncharacterized protein YlxW (UPF0749 family)